MGQFFASSSNIFEVESLALKHLLQFIPPGLYRSTESAASMCFVFFDLARFSVNFFIAALMPIATFPPRSYPKLNKTLHPLGLMIFPTRPKNHKSSMN